MMCLLFLFLDENMKLQLPATLSVPVCDGDEGRGEGTHKRCGTCTSALSAIRHQTLSLQEEEGGGGMLLPCFSVLK